MDSSVTFTFLETSLLAPVGAAAGSAAPLSPELSRQLSPVTPPQAFQRLVEQKLNEANVADQVTAK